MNKQNFYEQFLKTYIFEQSFAENGQKLRIPFANFTTATCNIPIFLSVLLKLFTLSLDLV